MPKSEKAKKHTHRLRNTLLIILAGIAALGALWAPLTESVLLGFTYVGGGLPYYWTGNYKKQLNDSGFYANNTKDALPQTALYYIVTDFFAEPLPEGKTVKKVLVVGHDGAQAGGFLQAKEGVSAALALKEGGGAAYAMYAGGPWLHPQITVTACGWSALETGEWSYQTGVTANGVTKPADSKHTFFTQLTENGTIAKSVFLTSWDGHFTADDATLKNELVYDAENGLNTNWVQCGSDEETVEKTLQEIALPDCAGLIFPILEYCDHAGHAYGQSMQIAEYKRGFAESDAQALKLINAVKARPTYQTEDWLILMTSDHGGCGKGHGVWLFSTERQVFLISSRPLDWEKYVQSPWKA
ncbi:MAG: hypothetical protein LBR73_01365 [Oscillospiraceae bacterium]|jgi:hypothetical protein|nr:hypothetical protein [Oscillospiraceae bacterium]